MIKASYYPANKGTAIGIWTQMHSQLYSLTFSTIIKKIGNVTYCILE
jgi:hypothetical protein